MTDSVSDENGGFGTDILTNIQKIEFDDKQLRVEISKDIVNKRIEGTDFKDVIQGEGIGEKIYAGSGNDIVKGGDDSDEVELGLGNDFFDGEGNKDNFDFNTWASQQGIKAEHLGNFNYDDAVTNVTAGPNIAWGCLLGVISIKYQERQVARLTL